MRNTLIKWLGYLILLAAAPLAVAGAIFPVNEYKAQGFDAVDCDGPLQVMLFAGPALLIFGLGALINGIRYQKRPGIALAVICILICIPVGLNILKAIKEVQFNIASEACGR